MLLMASGGCNCLEPPARISAMALRAGGANAAGEGHLSVWMGACVSVLRKTIAMVVKGDMVGVQRLLGLRVAGLCVRVAQLSMRVRSPVCVAARWQFNQTASIWLERATHPCGCVHVCVCFTTMAGGRWLHGTASAVAGAASAASPRYVRSKGSGCCTRWRSRHSRAMAGPLIRVDGCTCVCASQRWRWWSMDAWLARSRLLALLAAELCVRFA